MSNTSQLNLFEQPNPCPVRHRLQALGCQTNRMSVGLGWAIASKITNAGSPLQHLNGQKGSVVSLVSGNVAVQVEGVAVVLMFPSEALEQWTPISEYTSARDCSRNGRMASSGRSRRVPPCVHRSSWNSPTHWHALRHHGCLGGVWRGQTLVSLCFRAFKQSNILKKGEWRSLSRKPRR